MSMSKGSTYFDEENDEDVMQPLCGNEKSPLDLATSEETNQSTSRNLSKRQKLFISCFVGVSLMVVVVVCVVMTRKSDAMKDATVSLDSRRFTIDDAFTGGYYATSYAVDWVSDHSYLHSKKGSDELLEYDMEKVNKKVIMSGLEAYASNMATKKISSDRTWLLFSNNSTPLYRHSSYSDYYLKNIVTGKIDKIHPPNKDVEKIRYCRLSSTGKAIILVHKCNIYYIPDLSKLWLLYQLTSTGVPKKVFNGVPDWVYEEEILNSGHAMSISPDGRYLSYATFDATKVPFFRFPKYGPASQMYPTIEKIAYPKVGYPNPTIKITVVDLEKAVQKKESGSGHTLSPPAALKSGEYYYTAMLINKKNQVFVQWMNRAQNVTVCMLYDVANGVGKMVEKHTTPNGWIDDDYVKPSFSKDGRYYITMLPSDAGNGKGKFRHLAKVNVISPYDTKNTEFLTTGAYTVHDIKCWDADQETVYFRSTKGSPRYRHVYSYNVKTKVEKCISCGKIKDKSSGKNCTYYTAKFSKKCSWMVLYCKGPITPQSYMIGLKTSKVIPLVDNKDLKEKLKSKDTPNFVYYTVKSGDGKFDIPVREIRPHNFNPNKKYPVLFDVYGGPNTQKVTDKFTTDYFAWTFVGRDIIVVNFDARGSGYYGYNYLYAVYRNLGKYEALDAVTVAKHLQSKSYVDKARIAIWGWSYGGFYAATTLAMAHGVINTAVSVAPVTDWRYYDTVYSERYMGFPSKEDNLAGYERTSVMKSAKNFIGKNFMLIHGTGDDNVHFQNSAQLAAALINAKVDFKSQFYTDKRHGIASGGHVYYVIADYLLTKLKEKHKFSKFGWYG